MSHIPNLVGYTRKQLKRLNTNLKQSVSTGDVEAIHDLRVASRRLDQPIKLMADQVKSGTGRRLRRAIEQARKAFRTVRDLDVLLLGLSKAASNDHAENGYMVRLEEILNAEREQAFSKALRKYERIDVQKINTQVEELCKAFAKSTAETDLENQLAQTLAKRHAKLLEYQPQNADADLHEARILLKRYRYALELTHHVKGHKEEELIQNLVQMQERLGNWSDNLVAINTVSRIITEENRLIVGPGWSAQLLRYAANRAEDAESYRQQIVESWPSFCAATHSPVHTEEVSVEDSAHAVANTN